MNQENDAHPVETDTYAGIDGVWFLYDYNHGPYVISIHENIVEPVRKAAQQGYGKVGFWPYGAELREAVDRWEGKP